MPRRAPLALLACLSACATAPGPPPVPVDPALRVEPQRVTLQQGSTQRFRAVLEGVDDPRVEWSVVDSRGAPNPGGGTVDAEGLYSPGRTIGRWFYVRATSVAAPALFADGEVEVLPAGGPTLEEWDALVWEQEERAGWTLHRARGPVVDDRDADVIAELVDRALLKLREAFATREPDALLAPVDVHVHVLPAPRGGIGVGTMTIRTGNGEAHVRLLAPSAHPGAGEAGWAPGYDELYFEKNLVHELSTVFLERMTQRKRRGWSFHSAPSWFVQGYEEYLGCTLAGDDGRLDRYVRLTVADSRVSPDFSVREPYGDGCALLAFLHDVYGAERVLDVLSSDEPDFWAAIEAVLGAERAELFVHWWEWGVRR